MNQLKTLSASQNWSQGDVIDRAITLLATQIELQEENRKKMINIVPKISAIPGDRLASVKEGGYIILELKFEEMALSMFSLLQVNSCNGVFGAATFIDVRDSEKYKTFENFEKFKGKTINFSMSDIWDYTDNI